MNYNLIDLLLVEDNAQDAELTIRELKKNNFSNNFYHAIDGDDALHFIFATGKYTGLRVVEHTPKLILLDIQLPKVNGTEVLKRIREDERTKMTPVVILTSSKLDPDIQTCYSLGANSYIVKPVNFESFAEAIRNLGFFWMLLNQPPTLNQQP